MRNNLFVIYFYHRCKALEILLQKQVFMETTQLIWQNLLVYYIKYFYFSNPKKKNRTPVFDKYLKSYLILLALQLQYKRRSKNRQRANKWGPTLSVQQRSSPLSWLIITLHTVRANEPEYGNCLVALSQTQLFVTLCYVQAKERGVAVV